MTSFPEAPARRIGAAPDPTGEGSVPETLLDWAIRYARQGLHVFPCENYVGIPTSPRWYALATTNVGKVVEWWSEKPDADIAVVPDLSGHFVIAAIGGRGQESLNALERQYGALAPSWEFTNQRGNRFLWFKGEALSSSEKLGPEIYVFGPGRFLYLPPWLARVKEEAPLNERVPKDSNHA